MDDLVASVISDTIALLNGRASFDLVADFTAIFPNEIISGILGIPRSDRPLIRQWTHDILFREEGAEGVSEKTANAYASQLGYFYELAREKREHPGDDMISSLTEAEIDEGSGARTRLTDEEIADFSFVLGAAGTETVTKLVANAAVLLHRNPEQRRMIVDDPGLVAAGVEESLRYWAPSHLQGRYTMADITLHGVTIPKSSPVFLITGAANRDPRAYPDPDRFDITRTELPVPVGFGFGVHYCIGAALARTESRCALTEILTRWPEYAIDEEGMRRVHMANVAGFSNVPFAVAA
jgi:cytochrome P450